MYETMRLARPDFFIHTGDTIYADSPVPPEIKLPDGTMWRNVVTAEKSKVAETLDEFRGNYTYNLLDDNVRRFNREIPQLWLWDDHEVRNNWYPGMSLDDDERYRQKDSRVLAANARQAFLEYSPIRLAPGAVPPIYRSCSYGPLLEVFAIDLRTYRGPNTSNRQASAGADAVHAGARQLAWLKRALSMRPGPRGRSSRAICRSAWSCATDRPHSKLSRTPKPGNPLGRELEIADLLRFIRQERIRNVVWMTGDVHYAAAHHYDPSARSSRTSIRSGNSSRGRCTPARSAPNELDATFGPEVRFASVKPGAPGEPPAERRLSVLRSYTNRGADEGDDGRAEESGGRDDL